MSRLALYPPLSLLHCCLIRSILYSISSSPPLVASFIAMAQRKEVFLAKVLQKLYPAAPKLQTEPNATPTESLPKKSIVKRTTQETPNIGNTSSFAKRVYTVLPPPADYKTDEDKSVRHSELENLNTAEDPAEKSGHESSDDKDQSKEPGEEKRRRKRKKRKDHVTDRNQTAVNEGQDRLSKNKKRKLKKKRHKEKLLSMGLVPRAAAVEFTYQKEALRQEEEEEGSCQVGKLSQDSSGNP